MRQKWNRNRRNNRPKRVLRLLDLEHARTASAAPSHSVGIGTRSTSSSTGTAPSRGWRSIALWCFGIEVTWNPVDWLPGRLTFGWEPFGGWPTRRQIAVCLVRIWPQGSGALRA